MKREQIDELVLKLRAIAGEIGSQDELENAPDSENYEYQVNTGLAEAVAEIMEYDPEKLFHWLGYCIISMGGNVDPRISALMDALENEVEAQLVAAMEADPDEKESD